jgi:hypothetical protein
VFTYSGEMSGLPEATSPSILNKSYRITAEVEIPQGGAEGMLNTLGAVSESTRTGIETTTTSRRSASQGSWTS